MKGNMARVVLNVLAAVATIAVNILANALPLNGQNTGAISDRFKVIFVPAGYVFAIWGLIYIGILAYAIFQALPAQRANPRLERIGYLFVLSCAANVAWLFLWHFNLFLGTIVAMAVLLVSLIGIYVRLGIGRERAPLAERWAVQMTFSVYLGWVSVATIANATDVLNYVGWSGWGISAGSWAAIMLVVGVALAALVSFMRRDTGYVLVFVWAYVGIALKQAAVLPAAQVAWVGAAALAVLAVLSAWRNRRQWQGASR